jgi:xylulokinase
MPELISPAEAHGRLTADAARLCGLPAGIPVVGAGGDGHCFSLGAAAVHPSAPTLTLGTSAVLGVGCDSPVLGTEFRTLLSCLPGRYLLESVIQCGSATVNWFDHDFLDGTAVTPPTPRELEQSTARVPPGCDGLMALPHWRGVRVPHPDASARGVVVGWSDTHTAAHLRRAIMEGIAFEVNALLDMVERRTHRACRALVLGGGGAASDTWCAIIADVLNRDCLRPPLVELGSLGAALCAAALCRHRGRPDEALRAVALSATAFKPSPANHDIYSRMAGTYARLYADTRGISRELAAMRRRDPDASGRCAQP